MVFRRDTKRISYATKSRPQPNIKQAGLGFMTGWSHPKHRTHPPREIPTIIEDKLLIGFEASEGYTTGSISDSGNNKIQNGWSGGAQEYFQNDSTDDERILSMVWGGSPQRIWYTGDTSLYGLPSQGSPFTPPLNIEKNATNENNFNSSIRGKTFVYSFDIYVETDTSYGVLKIYNGSYKGDDRTGLNLNIFPLYDPSGGYSINVTTYTYDINTDQFYDVSLGTLEIGNVNNIKATITYSTDGNPENDVYQYIINGNDPEYINSWPNLWRKKNGHALVYGSRLAFTTNQIPGERGWKLDNILLEDPIPPVKIPFGYVPPTKRLITPKPTNFDVSDLGLGHPQIGQPKI